MRGRTLETTGVLDQSPMDVIDALVQARQACIAQGRTAGIPTQLEEMHLLLKRRKRARSRRAAFYETTEEKALSDSRTAKFA